MGGCDIGIPATVGVDSESDSKDSVDIESESSVCSFSVVARGVSSSVSCLVAAAVVALRVEGMLVAVLLSMTLVGLEDMDGGFLTGTRLGVRLTGRSSAVYIAACWGVRSWSVTYCRCQTVLMFS